VQTFQLSRHAARQAAAKGFDAAAIYRAANNPAITYENYRFPGQWRHIRDGIVTVVDPATGTIITAYSNVVETALRADQIDADARRYGARQATA